MITTDDSYKWSDDFKADLAACGSSSPRVDVPDFSNRDPLGFLVIEDVKQLATLHEDHWATQLVDLANAGAIIAAANGRLPASSLSSIPGGRLEHNAARAWNAMREHIGRHHGIWIAPLGPNSSYRTYTAQLYFWNLYTSGRGNVAAHPGTSNHGWGNAVDVATTTMAYYILKYGPSFGWSHAEGARVGEWWHFTYVGGTFKPAKKFKPLRYRSEGRRVKWVQRRLRHKGFKSVPGRGQDGYGFYGRATVSAVKRFQNKHGLKADGIVGAKTWRRLAR